MNSNPHYGGRSGQQMNVNPWEGGMVPGGRSGVAGLLPTPPQASNLLSQLSSPEAQLALASNLLSTLLRPQQQTPQVPSLLSLGSVGQMGNAGGGYRQNSGYGPNAGRYQDPGPNRRKRMDSRRQEPYNKPMQGRRTAPARGGPERKPGSQGLRSPSVGKSRSGSGTKPGGKADRKDDDKEPKKDKDEEDDKDSGAEKKTDEEDVKREDGEDGEKKRDWKDEKKSEESGDNKDDKDDEGKDKSKDKEKDKDVAEKAPTSRYSGIPAFLFYCHVCKKHMWDDNSFQNHLKGRTHQLMMDKLEESYKIKVELMRHEQKVAEQQREIELERMKRQGKKVNMNIREYCTMCDLHFFGNLIVHRKNDRHQQLKTFLHPRCLPCGKEFPTRVEWDHHKLTPLHLKKTAEARKNRKSGSDDELGIEELIAAEGGRFGDDLSKKEIKVRTREEEEDEIKDADKSFDADKGEKTERGDGDADKGEGADKDEEKDGETTTIGNLRFRVPKYNPDVAVGLSLLKKMSGQTCRACHRFFINAEDAKTHCRTLMHYNNFVALIKEKAKAAEAKERREAKAEAQKKREGSPEKTEKATKRTEDMSTVDDEGNWKRRKVANAEEEDEDADVSVTTANDDRGKEVAGTKLEKEEEAEDKQPTNGSQKYDPLEADAEESNPEDERKDAQAESKGKEEEDKTKVKKEDSLVADDNLWAEVDRDIGNLLDTVDGEGETESLNDMIDDDLAPAKQETDSPSRGRNSARNKATRGALAARARGRKKK